MVALSQSKKEKSNEIITPHDKFQMINIRDISRNTSAFSAIASENISKGLMVALSQSKKEKSNEIITPHDKFQMINIRDISRNTSAFSAIASEI